MSDRRVELIKELRRVLTVEEDKVRVATRDRQRLRQAVEQAEAAVVAARGAFQVFDAAENGRSSASTRAIEALQAEILRLQPPEIAQMRARCRLERDKLLGAALLQPVIIGANAGFLTSAPAAADRLKAIQAVEDELAELAFDPHITGADVLARGEKLLRTLPDACMTQYVGDARVNGRLIEFSVRFLPGRLPDRPNGAAQARVTTNGELTDSRLFTQPDEAERRAAAVAWCESLLEGHRVAGEQLADARHDEERRRSPRVVRAALGAGIPV